MSKLYCEITESARRTTPTARAHDAATVRVKNWGFAVECRMIDNGGDRDDKVRIAIIDLATGHEHVLVNGMIRDVLFSDKFAPAP